MYVCDWYNPVKGHAQYSLRDERRDRVSGRIFRIMPKGAKPQQMPQIAGAPLGQLLDILKRPEYRYRYWTKRELRDRDPARVKAALDTWVAKLDPADTRHRHHQIEAVWLYRGIGVTNTQLLGELLECDDHRARAAATHQFRYWHDQFDNGPALLRKLANDPSGLVRMEAAIAASYIGTPAALDALLDTIKHPNIGHLSYAIRTALGSRTIEPMWKGNADFTAEHPELAVFMTAFYMFRALFMTFEGTFKGGSESDPESQGHGPVHLAESSFSMLLPMVLLAIPAVSVSYTHLTLPTILLV